MALNTFDFVPEDGFLDTEAYPDPSTEAQVRTQLMSLHTQTKDYLNTQVKTAIEAIAASQGDPEAIAEIMDALDDLDDIVGTLPDDVAALDTRVTALESAVSVEAYIMSENDWDGSTFSFEDDYSSSMYNIEIALNGDEADAAELAAWGAAGIVGSATTNVVTALGSVPSIPLHIILKVEHL